MKLRIFLLSFQLSVFSFLLCACTSPTGSAQADPAQVAKLTAVATLVAQTGVAITLQQHPEYRADLIAVAEAIEQAAALPQAPAPSNLLALVNAAAGPYAALGLQAGFAIYQQLYAANTATALDKQPAFRAVLLSLAGGIRSAAQGIPAAGIGGMSTELSPTDYVLRAAR